MTDIRDYYEQLCATKMDNLQEMDRVLEKFKPSKTESGKNRNYEQVSYKHRNQNCD